MRQIIIDHVRYRRAKKRDSSCVASTPLDTMCDALEQNSLDLMAVHEALQRLAALDPILARLVDLHFFAGIPLQACAPILDCSPRTVTRYWNTARDWLRRELSK